LNGFTRFLELCFGPKDESIEAEQLACSRVLTARSEGQCSYP